MSSAMHLYVVASLLRRGKSLDNLSTGLLVLSLALGLTQFWITSDINPWFTMTIVAMVLTGMLEKSQAFRVAFDADLFQYMADHPSQLNDLTQELDQVLSDLRLQPVDKGGRDWDLRTQGALKQLRQQVWYIMLQLVWLVVMIIIFPWLYSA
ncbi:hypothetical protein KDX38_17380 [Pseudomonas sp. CDFA 602]|uniref:hypothetical protein n=1 Tax=Pseudomonas californiensis TaxID=2829823 RepID=UPI001E5F0B1F|nr:hypothetical protein [Pseudomonas californiensis]MCD5995425.1 hypothetical protein [Pseudomonas californiensis]MCD6000979.1 hypothetical protein [Pseudomonas californiensis]